MLCQLDDNIGLEIDLKIAIAVACDRLDEES